MRVSVSLWREGDLRTSLTGWRLAAFVSPLWSHIAREDRGEATEMSRGLGDGPAASGKGERVSSKRRAGVSGPFLPS